VGGSAPWKDAGSPPADYRGSYISQVSQGSPSKGPRTSPLKRNNTSAPIDLPLPPGAEAATIQVLSPVDHGPLDDLKRLDVADRSLRDGDIHHIHGSDETHDSGRANDSNLGYLLDRSPDEEDFSLMDGRDMEVDLSSPIDEQKQMLDVSGVTRTTNSSPGPQSASIEPLPTLDRHTSFNRATDPEIPRRQSSSNPTSPYGMYDRPAAQHSASSSTRPRPPPIPLTFNRPSFPSPSGSGTTGGAKGAMSKGGSSGNISFDMPGATLASGSAQPSISNSGGGTPPPSKSKLGGFGFGRSVSMVVRTKKKDKEREKEREREKEKEKEREREREKEKGKGKENEGSADGHGSKARGGKGPANEPGKWNRDMVAGIMGPPVERRG
jgi:hypothetical protein